MMDQRDRNILRDLTSEIKNLTEAIKPDSFHNRQVPALRRQTETLEYLREQRELYINIPQVSQETILHIIDRASELLLST